MLKLLIRIFLLLCIVPICRFNVIQPHLFQNFSKFISCDHSTEIIKTDNTFQQYFQAANTSNENGLSYGIAIVLDNKEISFQKILKGLFSFTAFLVAFSTVFICLPIKQNIHLMNRVLTISDKPFIDLLVIKI